jgi:hypothetical protein
VKIYYDRLVKAENEYKIEDEKKSAAKSKTRKQLMNAIQDDIAIFKQH